MKSHNRLRCLFNLAIVAALAGLAGNVGATLSDTIAQLKESVILVGTYSAIDSPRFNFRGTGFVVESGNLAITNAHVLPGSTDSQNKQIAVQIWNKPNLWSLRIARVIEIDRVHDLALISFEGAAVAPVKFSTRSAQEGDSIAFMGFPIGGALGFSHVTHRGTISSIAAIGLPTANAQQLNERAVMQLRQGNFEILQLDATAYPGNSGGPIFDPESGTVVGVMNSVLVKSTRESALSQPSGISYGIPLIHIVHLARQKP